MRGLTPTSWSRPAKLLVALLLLNASLSFVNVWPTPEVTWRGDLSVELAALVAIVALLGRRAALPSRRIMWMATIGWMCLVLGRYAETTSAALFGREINLYWDGRFIPDVAALFVSAAPWWAVVGIAVGLIAGLVLLALLLRWALTQIVLIGAYPLERRVLGGVAAGLVLVFFLQPVRDHETPAVAFATPVTPTYVRQVRLAIAAVGGPSAIPASPPMTSDLSRVEGADVFLLFLESYGAITYDRPSFAASLAQDREALEAAIGETNREVISAYVESPTFGGSSWLAHISLLSGIEVRTPDTNALLMSLKRDTLVTVFSRGGYRTVALMPGLWKRWPEGAFYGFDEIYGGERLGYKGPSFGWFDIPDQFALAALEGLEPSRDGRSKFVFFPTISTHTPFVPLPPYQPDWPRMQTRQPYDGPVLQAALEREPDWLNLAPSYVDAVAYAYAIIGGYLRLNPARDLVLVVLGDHQPPALVTGPDAPWDVPVHVIASRRAVLDRLLGHGFGRGLTPARPALGPMHTLLPVLLKAFGD